MSSTFGKGRKKSNTCQTLYEVSTVKSLLKEPSQDTIPTVRLQVFFFFFDLWIDANLISWQEWIEFIFVEDPTRKHLGVRNLLEQSSTEQTSLQTWLEMQRSNSILTFYFRIVRNRTCDSSGMLKDLRNWLKMTCTSEDVWCLAETFRFKLCVQEVSTCKHNKSAACLNCRKPERTSRGVICARFIGLFVIYSAIHCSTGSTLNRLIWRMASTSNGL